MRRNFLPEIIIYGAIALFVLFLYNIPITTPDNAVVQYYCDSKAMSATTKIYIKNELTGEKFCVSGDTFWTKTYEDPLKMVDGSGKVICEAGDSFNVIDQNDHAIMKNGKVVFLMAGEFNMLGDTYTIYDENGNAIATANFNAIGNSGELFSVDGKLLAQYNANNTRKDYVVSIFKENTFDEDAINMLFASFYSDLAAK